MFQNSKIKAHSAEIKAIIDKASNILLHCHPYPDPDSVCSALALRDVLISLGKNVTVIQGDTSLPASFSELKDISIIEPKDWMQIDKSAFDLFIILDSSSLSQITQKHEVRIPANMKTIVIDHHKSNTLFGDLNLVEPAYASTTQVLYELFISWGFSISQDVALYLFIGIYADTGGFKYVNSTPQVFSDAYNLVRIQPNYHKVLFSLDNNKAAIEMEMLGLALMSLEKYYSNKIVFSVIPFSEVQKRQLTKEEAMEGLVANTLRSVKGWQIVASLVEAEPNVVTVSLRTRDELKYDMSLIATHIGEKGGGHPGAAGTTIYKSIDHAKKDLLKKILMCFPDIEDTI